MKVRQICPKCGSENVAKGLPISCAQPRFLRRLYSRIGVTCVSCGHRRVSTAIWNIESRMSETRKMRRDS